MSRCLQRFLPALTALLALCTFAACKSSQEAAPPASPKAQEEGAPAPEAAADDSAPAPEAAADDSAPEPGAAADEAGGDGGERIYDYPPPYPGPHEGFDLNALREKLQGTWFVGGTAFSSIPHIWHVEGDDLIEVNSKGEKSEHTLQLLAPCYAAVRAKGGRSATYVNFVFDGDTLYQGLGMAGVRKGDRTIGCLAAGVYELNGDECTKWTRRSFPRKGEPIWDKEPGDCGYAEDGKVFYGDDTNSKRKIYGRETLQVMGDVLMTRQMKGNKAEKVKSLDEALARQKAKIKAIEDAKKTPTDLEFLEWSLAPASRKYQRGDRVWAAAMTRKKKWTFGRFRFDKAEGDVLTLKTAWEVFAPSAFTAPAFAGKAGDLAPGTPVLAAIGTPPKYARVLSTKADKVVVEYLSGRKVAERELTPDQVQPLDGDWTLGAPAALRDGDLLKAARVVHVVGDDVYVKTKDGVEKHPKADVTLVKTKPLRKRAKVFVRQSSGFAPLKFLPGRVQEVLGSKKAAGVAYVVKTDDGKIYTQSYGLVLPR